MTATYLARTFSTSHRKVDVRCPESVPVSRGAFTCRFRVGSTGDDATGTVTYTLTKDAGDTVTLSPEYVYD